VRAAGGKNSDRFAVFVGDGVVQRAAGPPTERTSRRLCALLLWDLRYRTALRGLGFLTCVMDVCHVPMGLEITLSPRVGSLGILKLAHWHVP
jgi:hypothetical protein